MILHLVSRVFLCSCVAGQLDCAACYARIAAGAARAYPYDLGVALFFLLGALLTDITLRICITSQKKSFLSGIAKLPLPPPPNLGTLYKILVFDNFVIRVGASPPAIYQTLPLGSKSSIFDQIWSIYLM